jgi:hypothetical protein
MISCRLQGGLGNQMFQISAAYALAFRNNDTSVFNFNECYTPQQGHTSNKYRDNIFSKVNVVDSYAPTYFYQEPKFSYTEIPYFDGMLLNGSFQSEKYFIDCKKEILKLFTISNDDKEIIKHLVPIFNQTTKSITSVNIRRGDYLNNQNYHAVCSVDYYKKAIEAIGDSYFIFTSDDLGWAIENFGQNENYFFPKLKSEILDLTMMSMCDNNVLSNGTFSWWGSYLNQNQNKITIAPEKWFGPAGHKDTQDIYQKDWITIDND